MKNFEYWEKELKELADKGKDFAVYDGKPVDCDSLCCAICDFKNCANGETLKWLLEERIEVSKINKRTKAFFDAIETGWVARDKDGRLYLYDYKPNRSLECGYWNGYTVNIPVKNSMRLMDERNAFLDFLTLDFIKWEDEEPWRVEDIRALEVVV